MSSPPSLTREGSIGGIEKLLFGLENWAHSVSHSPWEQSVSVRNRTGSQRGRSKWIPSINTYDFAFGEKKKAFFFMWYRSPPPFLPHRHLIHRGTVFCRNTLPKGTYGVCSQSYWAMCEWFDTTCGEELMDILKRKKGQTRKIPCSYMSAIMVWAYRMKTMEHTIQSLNKRLYDYDWDPYHVINGKVKFRPRLDTLSLVSKALDMVPTVLRIFLGLEFLQGDWTEFNIYWMDNLTSISERPFLGIYNH